MRRDRPRGSSLGAHRIAAVGCPGWGEHANRGACRAPHALSSPAHRAAHGAGAVRPARRALKLAFPAFGAGGVSLARVVGAAAVFQIIRLARGEPSLSWAMHGRVALASAFGIVANQLLFMYGLERTSATHATILVTTVPVATIVVAVLAGREALKAHRVVGIALAFAGAALVVTSRASLDGGEWLGDAMVLGNSFSYAIYLVLGRDLLLTLSPWSLAAWLFTWGCCRCWPSRACPYRTTPTRRPGARCSPSSSAPPWAPTSSTSWRSGRSHRA